MGVSVGKPMLQVGSNLFELIEFTVTSKGDANPVCSGGEQNELPPTVYAVNVAKVREVIRLPTIVPCLSSCDEVLGVFNLRGMPIPAIHLAKALGYKDEPVTQGCQLIVTEFSRRLAGFIVSNARRIRRVSWDRVLPPSSEAFNAITGVMLVEKNEFIFILDFERLLLDIEGRTGGSSAQSAFGRQVASTGGQGHLQFQHAGQQAGQSSAPTRRVKTVIVVDDSTTARRAVCDLLRGMQLPVLEFTNGELAWNALQQAGANISDTHIVISDVEMPRLDGYSLVKRIREDEKLKNLPIILHSSLTGDVNRERAKAAGADAYVSKFNHNEILAALELVLNRPAGAGRIAS